MQLATHNGCFHADDIFSAVLLTTIYQEATLVRTRDQALLDKADIVFDVGATYAPQYLRFDHHFKGSPVRPNGIPYSSFGLLWEHLGRNLVSAPAWDIIDSQLVTHIDAVDTGYPGAAFPLSTGLSHVNPTWIESKNLSGLQFEDLVDRRFRWVLNWLQPLFQSLLRNPQLRTDPQQAVSTFITQALQPLQSYNDAAAASIDLAREHITKAINPSSPLILLDCAAYPWAAILPSLPEAKHVLFVIYPTSDTWRCQCVPTAPNGFIPRQAFPDAWRGQRDAALQQVAGTPDLTFCHPAGFLLGAKTQQALLAVMPLILPA